MNNSGQYSFLKFQLKIYNNIIFLGVSLKLLRRSSSQFRVVLCAASPRVVVPPSCGLFATITHTEKTRLLKYLWLLDLYLKNYICLNNKIQY